MSDVSQDDGDWTQLVSYGVGLVFLTMGAVGALLFLMGWGW